MARGTGIKFMSTGACQENLLPRVFAAGPGHAPVYGRNRRESESQKSRRRGRPAGVVLTVVKKTDRSTTVGIRRQAAGLKGLLH